MPRASPEDSPARDRAWDDGALKSQVKLNRDPNAGWVSYCTKRSWLALPGIHARFACDRPGSPWRLSFDCPALTMTNDIRAEAQELHRKAREIVQEARHWTAALEVHGESPAYLEPALGADVANRAEPAPDETTRPSTAASTLRPRSPSRRCLRRTGRSGCLTRPSRGDHQR